MSTITRITGTAIAAVLALGALTACSSDITPEPAETVTATATEPAPVQTTEPTPVETTPAEPEVVADENSQVIDGVLYQGTERAPVRIGDDTPGQAPAIDSEIPDVTNVASGWEDQANQVLDAGKYIVCLTFHANVTTRDGFQWEVIQANSYGNVRVLEEGPVVQSIEAAAAGPFTLDGRTLDRAEYVVIVLTD